MPKYLPKRLYRRGFSPVNGVFGGLKRRMMEDKLLAPHLLEIDCHNRPRAGSAPRGNDPGPELRVNHPGAGSEGAKRFAGDEQDLPLSFGAGRI